MNQRAANQNNEAYVENTIRGASQAEKKKMLSILDSYGENRWWLDDDSEILVKNQIKEQYLLVDFNRFKRAIEDVLRRPVKLLEFDPGENFTKLTEEIEKELVK